MEIRKLGEFQVGTFRLTVETLLKIRTNRKVQQIIGKFIATQLDFNTKQPYFREQIKVR